LGLTEKRKDKSMKTDRELLELAAKARDGGLYDGIDGLCICTREGGAKLWNPLSDDGDALRLMVALGIRAEPMASYCVAYAGSVCAEQFTERSGDDRPAAMRRAIVRAAATIGARL
jgi:hypothetical protein